MRHYACLAAAGALALLIACGPQETGTSPPNPPPAEVTKTSLTSDQIKRIADLLINAGEGQVQDAPAKSPASYRPLYDVDQIETVREAHLCSDGGEYQIEGTVHMTGYFDAETSVTSAVEIAVVHKDCQEADGDNVIFINGNPKLTMAGTVSLGYSLHGTWSSAINLTMKGNVLAADNEVKDVDCAVDLRFAAEGTGPTPRYSGKAQGTVCGETVEQAMSFEG